METTSWASTARNSATTRKMRRANWANDEIAAPFESVSASAESTAAAVATSATALATGIDERTPVVRKATTTNNRLTNVVTVVAHSCWIPEMRNATVMITSSRPKRSVGFARASFIVNRVPSRSRGESETSGPRSPMVGRLGSGRDGQALRTTGLFRTGVGRVLGCGPRISCSGSMRSTTTTARSRGCCVDGMPTRWSCRAYWTLDDLRDPDPRLFRPPSALPSPSPVPRRRSQPAASASEQLLLLTDVVAVPPDDAATEADPDAAVPWTPTFDEQDDLDGLLSARSPLLARAFRGGGRPRPS